MELQSSGKKTSLDGLSIPQTRIFWNSRRRSATGQSLPQTAEPNKPKESSPTTGSQQDSPPALSERRKALFEPLEPTPRNPSDEAPPPPDFDAVFYPKGWLIGKKRKLVNVDVVESMRRIAVQEMNRKDREINGLNEQLEEDARVLEHLQLQLLQERSKRGDVERENSLLQNQVSMLMNMLQDVEGEEEVDTKDT